LTAAFVTHHLFDESGKEATFAATAVAATGGWLIWVAHTTPWSASSLGALVAINTVLGPIYGLLRWRRDAHNRKRLEARAQAREDAKRHSWEAILARAGAKDITVGPSTVFRAGFTLPLVLGPTSPDYRTLQTMIPSIERIAASTTGLPIRAGSIQLLRGEDMMAHQAYLVVPTRDVLAETIELPEWIGPRSITEPLLTGQYVDGNDVQVTLRGFHGMFAGMTRFGKTALLNTHLAQLVRCIDNVTWCLAGNKAVRWLRPWLLPWLRGYAAVPPIDWVTSTVDEALLALLDLYRAIDGRQAMVGNGKTEWEPTPEAPQITVLIDESTDLLESTVKVVDHKGAKQTFSSLLLTIIRTAGSEAIHVIFCSQRGTATLLGPNGGDLKSQLAYRVGFRAAGNMTDVNAVFSSNTTGVDLSVLPKGAWYVELIGDERPRLAKGYWTSPDRINTIAIEATAYVGGVDEATASHMQHYAGRWSRPNQIEFLQRIAGGPLPEGLLRVLTNSGMTQTPTQPPQDGAHTPDDYGYDASDLLQQIADWAEHRATATDPAMLEMLFAQPAIPDYDRNTAEALPPDTLQILAALHASGILYQGSGEEWVPAVDVRALAVKDLRWADNPEGDRRVSTALRAIGITSRRRGVSRITVYSISELRKAAKRHNDPGGSTTR